MKYNIYKCTSSYQKDFLKDNGLDYLWVGIDEEHTTFWLFERNSKFQSLITQYKNTRIS